MLHVITSILKINIYTYLLKVQLVSLKLIVPWGKVKTNYQILKQIY